MNDIIQDVSIQSIQDNEDIQKKNIVYDSVGFFTPQMIKVFADLHLPWKFDPDVALKYDSEAYERMRRYPTIVAKSEEALAKLTGIEWHFFSESEQGIRTIPYLEGCISRIANFSQSRFWLARSYLEGRSWLQEYWKLMNLSIGDDKVRQWWIPIKLIPVHKSQFLLRHSEYYDSINKIKNIKFWWDRMSPVNMQLFKVDMRDYVTSVKDSSHVNWDYGWGKYDSCYPVHTYAINIWKQLADAIESVLFPAVGFSYDAKSGFSQDFTGAEDISIDTPANAAYLSQVRAAIKNLRNFGFFGFPNVDKIQMLDRNGGGVQVIMDMLRYFEQKMTEIISISITPGGGMESKGAAGSFSSARVGMMMRDDTLETLRKSLIEEPIQNQLVARIWEYNHQNFSDLGMKWSDAAVFRVGTPKPMDIQRKTQGFQIAMGAGIPVSRTDFYKHFNLDAPTDDKDTLKVQQPPQGAGGGQPGGQQGMGGGQAGMGMTGGGMGMGMGMSEEEGELRFAELSREEEIFGKKKRLIDTWLDEYFKSVRTVLISNSEKRISKAKTNIKNLLTQLYLIAGLLGSDEIYVQIKEQLKFYEANQELNNLLISEENQKVTFAEKEKEKPEKLDKTELDLLIETLGIFGEQYETFEEEYYSSQWYVTFTEAVRSILEAQPVLVQSAQELGEFYRENNVIGAAYATTLDTVETLRDEVQGYIEGAPRKEAIERIAQAEDWSLNYARTCLRTNTAEAHSLGRITQAENLGEFAVGWRIQTAMDADVRPNHRALHGLVASTEWFRNNPGYFPVLGYNCYDKKTEVMTNNGWKLFAELKGKEKFLSLNPETKDLEWVKAKKYIIQTSEKMYHFKHTSMDICVTPNHNMLISTNWSRKQKNGKLIFKEAQNVFSSNSIYKSSEWKGEDKEFIKINKFAIETEMFCKFMGYYLSEGSCSKHKKGQGKQYVIKISQKDPTEIYENIKEFPIKLWLGKEAIYIKDIHGFGKYLNKFGKSHKKYIPKEIKKLSPRYLRIFLDAYLYGDGSKGKEGEMFGRKTIGCNQYFTSSNRLASDLGEILVKSGKGVTYYLSKTKGKKCKFRNGTYTTRHNMWFITETKTVWQKIPKNIDIIENYNDFVYCVELEKNHTLFTRRNGKTAWCGNCRCEPLIVTKVEAKRKGWLDEEGELVNQYPPDFERGGADTDTFGVYKG